MTVKELIKQLSQHNQNARVVVNAIGQDDNGLTNEEADVTAFAKEVIDISAETADATVMIRATRD